MAEQSAIEAWPEVLPDGNTVIFTWTRRRTGPAARRAVADDWRAQDTDSGDGAALPSQVDILYSYGTPRSWPSPSDVTRLELRGTPVTLPETVRIDAEGAAHFSVSATGSLVYAPAIEAVGLGRDLMLINRDGLATRLPAPTRPYAFPRMSPDGRRLAVTIEGAGTDIWVYDLLRDSLTRLTFDGRSNVPIWAPEWPQHHVRVSAGTERPACIRQTPMVAAANEE